MTVLKVIVRIIAFICIVGICNLRAGIKAEPVPRGKSYFSHQGNLRRHIVWTSIGIAAGIVLLR